MEIFEWIEEIERSPSPRTVADLRKDPILRELQRNTHGTERPVYLCWAELGADAEPDFPGIIQAAGVQDAATRHAERLVDHLEAEDGGAPLVLNVSVRDGRGVVTKHGMVVSPSFSTEAEALAFRDDLAQKIPWFRPSSYDKWVPCGQNPKTGDDLGATTKKKEKKEWN